MNGQKRIHKAPLMEASTRADLDTFYIREGIDHRDNVLVLLAAFVVFCSAGAATAAGWLLAVELLDSPDLRVPLAFLFGGIVGAFVGRNVLQSMMDAGSNEYEVTTKGQPFEPEEASVHRVSRRQAVMLNPDEKKLLHAFAVRYRVIGTAAINHYEGEDSPFTADIAPNKKKAIKQVHSLIVRMGLGRKRGNQGLVINSRGEKEIEKWAQRIFDDPPAPEGN